MQPRSNVPYAGPTVLPPLRVRNCEIPLSVTGMLYTNVHLATSIVNLESFKMASALFPTCLCLVKRVSSLCITGRIFSIMDKQSSRSPSSIRSSK